MSEAVTVRDMREGIEGGTELKRVIFPAFDIIQCAVTQRKGRS